MRNGQIIIDADAHVFDVDAVYRKWLPERYRARPSIFAGGDGFDRGQGGNSVFLKYSRAESSAEQNIADMDSAGIDVQVLYPTSALGFTKLRERDYCFALAQAYNEWMHDRCSVNPQRLRGMAIVPLHVDVQEAIKEAERAVSKLGLAGVVLCTYYRGRHVAHQDFWPFYEECNRLGIPVAIHGAGTDWLDAVLNFDTFLGIHTFSHAPQQIIACIAMMYSGILERCPDLRIAFLEAGAGWVPYWMERMDGEWARRKWDAPDLKMAPSEYMKSGRVYVSCEPDERSLPYVIQEFGDDALLYPSDYPHHDSSFVESVAEIAGRTDISEASRRKILFDNPQRFYGFKVDTARFAPAPVAARSS